MIVATPDTPASLMNGTTTLPEPPVAVAVMVLAPLTLKRPMLVVKITAVPSATGPPLGVMSAAVTVVELAPSAGSDVCPAVSVMPTTGLTAGGDVGGGVLGGVVLGGVVLGGVVLGGGASALPPPPPPPAF
jgi:hypothetical protein